MVDINLEEIGKEINLKKIKTVNSLPVPGSENARHSLDYFEVRDSENRMDALKLKYERIGFDVILSFVNYKKGVAGIVWKEK